jgi:exodeoxyribonuclease VII large subunit
MAADPTFAPEGIPGSGLSGPWPVGAYARKVRDEMRKRPRLQLFGEVWGLKVRATRVYFELRDADGAMACSMWRDEFDRAGLRAETLRDGAQVVVAGGPDYYPGSRTASPGFSFAVLALRIAGEGDLLAQLDRLRKVLDAQGLFAPQKQLARRAIPRTIGVVTAETGQARHDITAGLARRGWAGRLVWAFAPVQDRHAAPRVTAAVQDLAATGAVDVIIVARGGGSMADLFCFCDETLCRTVALLPVPVIASVGHHTDRTLLDDVAAVTCSTPTHAAEAAVGRHVGEARAELARAARRLDQHAHRAVLDRARRLATLSRAPARYVVRERERLHQKLREIRAAGTRRLEREDERTARAATVLDRKAGAARHGVTTARAGLEATTAKLRRTSTDATTERRRDLDRLLLALAAHDPQRTLERGYALVEDPSGAPLTTAAAALAAAEVRVRFADGTVDADVREAAPAGAAPAADGDAATHDREADAARARPGGAAFASLFTPTTEED